MIRPTPLRLSALGFALALALSACGRPAADAGSPAADADSLRGVRLPEPLPRPDVTLVDTDGEPYDVARETDGRLTFLFFGYTHCPDVCPVQMGSLAGALKLLGLDVRERVSVVFVSTDPARDSLPRIRSWLDRWDRDFVGLRGDPETVAGIQRSLHLPASVAEAPDSAGDYTVGHSAQVVAFTADDSTTVVYPFGTRQADWVHDIPILLKGPGRAAAAR